MSNSSTRPVVFFYIQHLLGIGHAFRASRIARALKNRGCDTHLVWGGTVIPNLDLSEFDVMYLPPVRVKDASFSQLVHANGDPFNDKDKHNRRDKLVEQFNMIKPDILLTEAFPFGRRQMRFELLPLLDAAKNLSPAPLVAASIRDIMQENRSDLRVRESLDLVRDFYDLVLVHGDPELVRIEQSLQGASQIADKIRYTGLVVPDPPQTTNPNIEKCNVLVSAGGGAVGLRLMKAAIAAMAYSKKYPDNWLVAAGSELPQTDYQSLVRNCPPGMKLVRVVPDMVQAMVNTRVSVSRSGYNTLGDILRSECTCVLVPFTGGRETEQLRRAELMAKKGIATLLVEDDLTPQSLARAIDEAQVPKSANFNFDGANCSADILVEAYLDRKNPGRS